MAKGGDGKGQQPLGYQPQHPWATGLGTPYPFCSLWIGYAPAGGGGPPPGPPPPPPPPLKQVPAPPLPFLSFPFTNDHWAQG